MKRLLRFFVLSVALLFVFSVNAQDYSNKGKDFWIVYTGHVDGTSSRMAIYITSDKNSSGTLSVAGNTINFTVTANQVTTLRLTNTSSPSNAVAYNSQTAGIGTNKGIHVVTDNPVVVYAHILNSARSGSTMVLPTNVLGRDYYVSSYKSVSGSGGASRRSEFAVVATEDSTTVEITPAVADANNTYPANTPFQVTLNKGDVYQFQSANDQDLTGSHVKSVATATRPCKPIGVFAGSTWTAMGCSSASSGDNLYQQLFPFASWGKLYYTAPFKNRSFDIFRILVQDPSTVVTVDGVQLNPATLIGGRYYEFNTQGSNASRVIQSDKPICVFQYMITQNCDGVNSDPEMVILNSVEQTLNDITVMSARQDLTPPNTNITTHYLNIICKTEAFSSLKIDGASPKAFPVAIPGTGYSYIQEDVTTATATNPSHRITSDSGFLCIAYGYGNVESYGYNAGTNVKDLYQFASVQNQYATVNFPATCKSSPFFFSMTFPYQPTQIRWVFGATLNGLGINDTTLTSPSPDSSWNVNGKQLYRYKLPSSYSISVSGTYPIKIFAQNPTSDGCSGEQEINYDLQVVERPIANFSFSGSGCVSDPIQFSDSSNTYGRSSIQWYWNFGDNQTSQAHNPPAHSFSAAGSYNVKFSLITDIGCISDTVQNTVTLSQPPIAKFDASSPNCVGKTIMFTDSSSSQNGNIVKWTWDFGDGSVQVVATSGTAQTHSYTNAGNYTVTLQVENAGGCKSTVYSKTISVSVNPTADFAFGNACLPQGTTQFSNQSTIADGTQSLLKYVWRFGDGGTSTAKDTLHNYSNVGPYNATLVVSSNAGCMDSVAKSINTIYEQPKAAIAVDSAESCYGGTLRFRSDQSMAANSTVTEWYWNFGDNTTSTQQNPTKQYTSPGTYKVKLSVKSAIGCVSDTATVTLIVNPLPTADFTVASPTCETKSISFTNSSTANAGIITKWTWNFGDGSGAFNAVSPTHIYAKYGSYPVTLQVETDKGCVSVLTSKTVDVHPLPSVGFMIPGNCINDPVSVFTDTSSITDGSQSQFKWQWNFGDPNASAANNTSAVQNGQHKYTATGNYDIGLTVTSKDGCATSLTQQFTVNGAVPVISFSMNSSQICSNDSLAITDNSTVLPGKLVKLEIYWDYNGDPTNKLVVSNPGKGATYKHAYPEFFAPATKTYRIKFVGYSGINCLTEKDTIITVKATPSVTFNAVSPVCAGDAPFQLQANATNLPGTGAFSGNGVSTAGLFNPTTAGAGTQTIRFTYTASNGCSNYKEQNVTVYSVPTVSAGPDKFVLEGGSATLNGSGSGNNVSYLWTPSTGLNNATMPEPLTTPADDITYTLTVTSADGCTASDHVFVKLLKAPTVPNVFTPNGDGINDRWEIKYIETYPGATVDVYNRYGSLIFHSVGYSKPWDGTYNGKPVPAGTYYYIVNPKNGRKPITGFIDVLR